MAKNFKELTKEDIEYITLIYNEDMTHAEKMSILSKKFGVVDRTIRGWWNKLNLNEPVSKLPNQLLRARDREFDSDADIVLFTAAQNKTGINRRFFNNILVYKRFLEKEKGKKVELIVAPSRYRNPTSPVEANKKQGEQWWVDEVDEYLLYNKFQFGDTLISADSRIRPTAKRPLTGYEVLAKDNNLVLPHPRIHFTTMPRFKGRPLRTMSTTGFLTNRNYSDSKAGETGWQHHSYGFVVIEKKPDGICHVPRNVKANSDGSFIDLIYEVNKGKVSQIKGSAGFIWGDIHASEINREVFDRTLDLYDILSPEITVLHDVFDGTTVNPHEVKDMFIQRRKIVEKKFYIKDEVQHSFDLVSEIMDTGSQVNVVLSNHDVFLDRHINDGNWKKDLHNSDTYLEYALIQQKVDLREYGTIYGYLLNKEFDGKVNYVNYGDSLDIMGYECGLHADNGVNGAKGSPTTFAKLNTKMIGAHLHRPLIQDGYTGVGVTCNIYQYYTRKGLSSWAHAHAVVHLNGKSQLLVFDDSYEISSLI